MQFRLLRFHGLRRMLKPLMIMLLFILCSGCLYPDEQRGDNPAVYKEYLMIVSNAVTEYRKATGLLPLINSSMETPKYEKFLVDFKTLKNRGFISNVPPNAFENGGTFYYLIINEETDPQVKLMDLVSYQQVESVQKKVNDYRNRNNGRLPAGSQAAPHFYWIDFGKLDMENVQVRSLFTGQYLNLILHDKGRVAIDYAPDIMKFVQDGKIRPAAKTDLRENLTENSFFVPAKSYPYYWVGNEPRIAEK